MAFGNSSMEWRIFTSSTTFFGAFVIFATKPQHTAAYILRHDTEKIDTGITGSLACLICCNMCPKYSKMSCLSSKPFHFDFHDSPSISSSIDTFLKL